MRKTERVFSEGERRVAMWAVVIAAVVAMMGVMIERMVQPSVGMYGAAGYDTALTPGVLDARPMVDAISRFNAPV